MGEKITPAVKSVPRSDGLKKGSANSTLTTPDMGENKVWSSDKEQKNKIFGK